MTGPPTSGVVVNLLDCDIVVHEFELLSRYQFSFRIDINTLLPQLWVKF